MPIYEFECEDCAKIAEELLNDSEIEIITCKSCGGNARKIPSKSTFHLKGQCWAKDGYGNKKSSYVDKPAF